MDTPKNKISLDIIMPHRIGDCLLTLPAILSLKELNKKYGSKPLRIRLICGEAMAPFIKKLHIAPTFTLSWQLKTTSLFFPSDRMFCYLVSSKTMGLKSKLTYGQNNENKKYLNFDVDIPYLIETDTKLFPDKNLLEVLKNDYKFSNVVINNFALCLNMGYTSEQIIEVLPKVLESMQSKTSQGNYLVCCMEAGYEKKQDVERRWTPESFFNIGEHIYKEYGISTVFIGMNKEPAIPEKTYFIDKRTKGSISTLADIIKNSAGYYGNDTGPLHLANFLNKPTCGIYTSVSHEDYGPINAENNFPVDHPKMIEDILPSIQKMIETKVNGKK